MFDYSPTHNPDLWVLLRLTNAKTSEDVYKILAGWHGGWCSEEWKLSSGVVPSQVIENGNQYESRQVSGTNYVLHKSGEGLNGIMRDALRGWQKMAESDPDITIEVVSGEATFNTMMGKA